MFNLEKERLFNMSQNTYHLRTDHIGQNRLRIQAELYNPGSQRFLIENGLMSASMVLEVGCGTGDMSRWMAMQLKPTAKILAIDSSVEQIAYAKNKALESGVKNVEYLCLPIEELSTLGREFDFIYTRLLLIHFKNPQSIIQIMCDALKPNGTLASEEFIISQIMCSPNSSAFQKRGELLTQFYDKNGLQPNVGGLLKEIFFSMGLLNIQQSLYHPIPQSVEEKSLVFLSIEEIFDKMVALNLITSEALEKIICDLKELSKSQTHLFVLSEMVQTVGKKR